MVVAHNLLAMNAQRQYNIGYVKKKSSMEKLSSGFKINKEAVFDDGKFELYETKNGMFNGLLNYIPFKSQKHSKESAICIKFDKEFKWCLDGEEGPVGDANLLINKQSVTVFSAAN